MTRAGRLSIGLVAPPVFGAILFSLASLLDNFFKGRAYHEQLVDTFTYLPFMVLAAFIAVGLQSILCALIVEFHVLPQQLTRMHFIRICVLLGALSGQIPGYFLEMMELLLPVGAVAGAITGYVLYANGKSVSESRA